MTSIRVMEGDCLEQMKMLDDDSVDLIMTSPPYAMQRKKTYGGIPSDEYVGWFLDRAAEMKRVLKPEGSLIVNIKEHCHKGERHTYVLELVLAMRKELGWLWIDELIWAKKNVFPNNPNFRLKDGWERLLHFALCDRGYMNKDAVKQPVKESTKKRVANLGKNDVKRQNSATDSGFGKTLSNFVGKEFAFPSNVLYMATETGMKTHSAVFPQRLPDFFIRLLCPPGGVVLDPFVGSGTTLQAAYYLGRSAIGIEIDDVDLLRENVALLTAEAPLIEI